MQASLELGDFDGIGEEERTAVTGYNRDDCLSAWRLRDWLEQVRSELLAAGAVIERPAPQSGEAGEDLSDWQQKIAALIERLTHDVPIDPAERSREQHARWLLAHILDWHRRENKAVWWEYFRLSALSADELLDERAGLSGLAFIGIGWRHCQRRQSIATAFRRRILIYAATKTCAGSAARGSARSRRFLWKIGPSI